MARKGAAKSEQVEEVPLDDQIKQVDGEIFWLKQDIESVDYSVLRLNTRRADDVKKLGEFEEQLVALKSKQK